MTNKDNTKQQEEWTGVILAAGKGMRAYPTTKYLPKVLMEIGGKTLLERNIEIMRNQLGIKNVVLVIGYLGEQIVDSVKKWDIGVNITFVTQKEQKGIGHALLQAEEHIKSKRFVVILGDELYIGSDHAKLKGFADKDFDGVLMFKEENDPKKISKNYMGVFDKNRVLKLIEKPKKPNSNLMGLGSYILTDKVFHYLKTTPKSKLRGEVEITDALSNMAESGNVYYSTLNVGYMNVTTKEDWNSANYTMRNLNFDQYGVSIVIPAYNEEETIAKVIEDYSDHPGINEILVVDNNSKDDTYNISKKAGARVIKETEQGYGTALRRGINEAKGDIVILTEGDGSFRGKDISKFLEYLKDCDMAIGTRTTRQMIEQGANMDFITRWANVFFGKFIELLWWSMEPRFTDVGCTYRAIWKNSYLDVEAYIQSNGPEFSTEMMIAMLICRKRVIEIPVTYYQRMGGESKHSISYYGKAKTALRMLKVVVKHRLGFHRLK